MPARRRAKRLQDVFSHEHSDPGRIVREATRLMIEQALEAEVEQAIGRGYYEHGTKAADGENGRPRAMRNGTRRACFDSAEGAIEFDVPQVRGPGMSQRRPERIKSYFQHEPVRYAA